MIFHHAQKRYNTLESMINTVLVEHVTDFNFLGIIVGLARSRVPVC